MFVTGSNEWREYASWPPAEGIKTRIYLRENSGLSFGKPPAQAMLSADDICDSYVSDPRKPVQYARKPMGM
jgi:predicted acyl esterase